jgi:hypothetical protein
LDDPSIAGSFALVSLDTLLDILGQFHELTVHGLSHAQSHGVKYTTYADFYSLMFSKESRMPVHDFATVQIYEGVDQIEVVAHFDPDLTALFKELKGRWNGSRRCWEMQPRFSKKTPAEIIELIRDKLVEIAPGGWAQATVQLKALACLIKGYEIYAGLGGLRISLPPGHPAEYQMKEVQGAQKAGKKWVIPAKLCSNAVIKQVLARMVKEDWDKYTYWMEPTKGRCLVGDLTVDETMQEAIGLEEGKVVFAALGFLRAADAKLADMPIKEFAFKVGKLERLDEDTVRVRLDYPDLKDGYQLLKTRVYEAKVRPLLQGDHATGEWLQKRR